MDCLHLRSCKKKEKEFDEFMTLIKKIYKSLIKAIFVIYSEYLWPGNYEQEVVFGFKGSRILCLCQCANVLQ